MGKRLGHPINFSERDIFEGWNALLKFEQLLLECTQSGVVFVTMEVGLTTVGSTHYSVDSS